MYQTHSGMPHYTYYYTYSLILNNDNSTLCFLAFQSCKDIIMIYFLLTFLQITMKIPKTFLIYYS